ANREGIGGANHKGSHAWTYGVSQAERAVSLFLCGTRHPCPPCPIRDVRLFPAPGRTIEYELILMNRVESGPEGTNRARRAGSLLFVNRVYPPSHGATGEMLADVAADLAANGWRVTVVAGDCPGVGRDQVTENGVRVIRVPGLRFVRGSTVRRAFAYLALYPFLFQAMVRVRDVDVVVTKTDPPLLLFTGGLMSLFRKTPLVHWAQDVYPEIAEELGVIRRGGVLASFLRKASTWALGRPGHVVAVGRCMRDLLVKNRGIAPERITIIPNWPPETVRPVEHEVNTFRKAHCLDGKFVVMYSGNMG